MTVLSLRSALNVYPATAVYVRANFLGGMMCVTLPALSCVNGRVLNPFALRAVDPKLELELVIDWSPPVSYTHLTLPTIYSV